MANDRLRIGSPVNFRGSVEGLTAAPNVLTHFEEN